MKLMIGGGGTGGHVSPGLGVAAVWEARHGKGTVLWAGRAGGIEERMAQVVGIGFRGFPAVALRRSLSLENLRLPFTLARGFRAAKDLLRQERPQAVLVTGGYVGLPLALAAWRTRTPLALLEPNAVPGLANRLMAPVADRFCLAYPPERLRRNEVVTGTPCRLRGLPAREAGARAFGLDPGRPCLLVLPGSQAAHAVNEALAGALPALAGRCPDWQILWMTGAADEGLSRRAAAASGLKMELRPFIEDVASAYAACDLVLCRSGASTLAELGVAGKPSLQIPYPHAAAGHQLANARSFQAAGAAVVMEETSMTAPRLADALGALMGDPALLEGMSTAAAGLGSPRAAEDVAAVLHSIAKEA